MFEHTIDSDSYNNFREIYMKINKLLSLYTAAVMLLAALPLSIASAGSEDNIYRNNIEHFPAENVLKAGGWSFLTFDVNKGIDKGYNLFQKGTGGRYAETEYALDLNNNNHVWYVDSLGRMASDTRMIVQNFTVSKEFCDAPGGINIKAKYPSACNFQIFTTSDGNPDLLSGALKTVYSNNAQLSYDVDITLPQGELKPGDDILICVTKLSASNWSSRIQTNFTIKAMYAEQVAQPVLTPPLPNIPCGSEVMIETKTEGAQIYYTLDGSDPKTSETRQLYSGPFALNEHTTVTCYAQKADCEDSYTTSKKYLMNYPIRDFMGVCNDVVSATDTFKWVRVDINWGEYEPERGVYNTQYLNNICYKALNWLNKGYTPLFIFAYGSVNWTVELEPYEFIHELTGDHYYYGEVKDVEFSSGVKKGRYRKITDRWGKVTAEGYVAVNNHYQMDDDVVPEWQDFVRTFVKTLSAEPYNLEYFQIWNEAYPSSSFYYGDLEQYMNVVHNPAAKVLREFPNAKIVFGGWPCCGPMSELIWLIDKTDAWDLIDVIDVHYDPLSGMDYLYRAAKERGVKNPMVWQTEMGFTVQGCYPPNIYPRTLRWAMEKGLYKVSDDLVKLFWFASGSPDDPKAYGWNCSVMAGTRLTDNGKGIKAFGELLYAAKLEEYNNFRTTPYLMPEVVEMRSGAEGFLLDNKKAVVAVHLVKENTYSSVVSDVNGTGEALDIDDPQTKITVDFKGVRGSAIVKRIDCFGGEKELTYQRIDEDTVRVSVPVVETNPEVIKSQEGAYVTTFYVSLESDTEITDGDWTLPNYPQE